MYYIEAVINFRTDTFIDKYLSHSPLLLQAAIVVVDCTTVYAGNFIRKKAAVEEFTCSLCFLISFFQSENVWFHYVVE